MKKVLVLTVAMLFVAGVAFAANSVVGSKHDMRGFIADEVSTEVCVYCHTPHGASTTITAPLWNHTDTGSTFSLYTSATLNGATSQPAGVSRACLSCHDGTIAVNNLINQPAQSTGTATNLTNASSAYLGTDLTNDHPVSITYRSDLDAGLRANTNATVDNGAGIVLQLFGSASPYTVECGSCHQVHDNTNLPFLRVANTNSQMCTTCHLK